MKKEDDISKMPEDRKKMWMEYSVYLSTLHASYDVGYRLHAAYFFLTKAVTINKYGYRAFLAMHAETLARNPKLKEGVNLIGEDFTKSDASGYNRIIANPPFSRNQDIDHVMTMYERLAPGGVIAAIMSQHWRFANEKKCTDFRQFLDDVGANVHEIEAGEFNESGTNIATVAVIIKKSK